MENNFFYGDDVAIVSEPAKIDFSNITRIEYRGQLVLTTEQLAKALSVPKKNQFVTTANLKQNFNNNNEHFIEGKHYFKLEGEELNILRVKNFYLQISPKTRTLYLWTKRGCARHCKSVGTDTAWDVFELLEDNYFNKNQEVPDTPIENISDFHKGKVLAQLAQSAQDPYTKRLLVAKAANLILGEDFLKVESSCPQLSLQIFKA